VGKARFLLSLDEKHYYLVIFIDSSKTLGSKRLGTL